MRGCLVLVMSAVVGLGTAAGSAAQNPASAKQRSVPTVFDFGAVGDGAADDTAALQQALDSGHGVFLPPGRYRFTADLRVRSGGGLIGLGFGSTLVGENAGLVITPRPEEKFLAHWVLRDLSVSRAGDVAGPAIAIVGNAAGGASIRGHLDNVTIDGSNGDGIRVANSYLITMNGPIIRRCRGAGLLINETEGAPTTANAISVHGGEIQSCRVGVDAAGVVGVLLSGLTIEGNPQGGVLLRRLCRNFVLQGCYLEYNGFQVQERADVIVGTEGKCFGVSIENCSFSGHADDPSPYAIRLLNCDSARIEGGWLTHYSRAFVSTAPGKVTGSLTKGVLRNTPEFMERQSTQEFRLIP